uniref:Protein kinase domain-containing protein ppk3 n=1 Tax=Lygus hesperus TaxID=30085 RepID=A0A0A9WBH6_LYGHE
MDGCHLPLPVETLLQLGTSHHPARLLQPVPPTLPAGVLPRPNLHGFHTSHSVLECIVQYDAPTLVVFHGAVLRLVSPPTSAGAVAPALLTPLSVVLTERWHPVL